MNNTSKLFILTCEIFLHSLVCEQTKTDLSKINWLYGIIQLHSNSGSALGQVFIVLYSYKTSFGFSRSDLNLNCGLCDHMIMWFASFGIRERL
jgi:hypothetical protein